jgi:hypothetical protein
VPDPDVVLAAAARVLKPDGRLVLTTGDIGSAYARRRGERLQAPGTSACLRSPASGPGESADRQGSRRRSARRSLRS